MEVSFGDTNELLKEWNYAVLHLLYRNQSLPGNEAQTFLPLSPPPPLHQAPKQKAARIVSSHSMVGEFHLHSSCSRCRQFLIKRATKLSNKRSLTFD